MENQDTSKDHHEDTEVMMLASSKEVDELLHKVDNKRMKDKLVMNLKDEAKS
jgi:hypothetical protein